MSTIVAVLDVLDNREKAALLWMFAFIAWVSRREQEILLAAVLRST